MDVGFAGRSRHARARAKLAARWRLSLRRGSPDRTSGAARAFIGRMGLVITLTTMFGPPVVYGVWNTYALEQRARQLATVGARHLEAQLSLSLVSDSLSQAAINVLQATSIASPGRDGDLGDQSPRLGAVLPGQSGQLAGAQGERPHPCPSF